jgi:colanic acid/amylovoran biosynthesis glycosyltransferase
MRVAYVMSRFPRLTETFVLFEILALQADGIPVDVYPLLRERPGVMHAEAAALVARAHYQPFLSWPILRSQVHFLRRRPGAYLRALADVVRGTWRSMNFLVGGLAIFPKVAHAAKLMRADGVTHVHCHFANHPALAGLIVHRLTGIPYSFTAHGSDLHVDRHMLCQKVAEAEFVVPISRFNREVILGECGAAAAEKLVVIHTGVDTDHFRPGAKPEADAAFTIACVGTLHEVKGQVHLVRACGRLARAGVSFSCHLVGDGPDREMLLREIERLELGGLVVLDGLLDRDALGDLLRRADVLVTPSVPTREGKREGIPVVLMEAMSSGLPVVASRLSGIPELVEDGRSGLLVEPGDDAGLAEALQRLHADPELRGRLAREGREKVLGEFDVRANARLLAERFRAASSGLAGTSAVEHVGIPG